MKTGLLMIDYTLSGHIQEVIKKIEWIQKTAKEHGRLNEQYFLDFQDKLNELSLDPEQ
jgi:hypothetical protein